MSKKLTRKEFIVRISLLGIAGVSGASLISACTGGEKKDPCSDLSGLTAEERETRVSFEYIPKSENPKEVCDNCAFWIKPEAGKSCGGCELFKGPVEAKGYCMGWAEAT